MPLCKRALVSLGLHFQMLKPNILGLGLLFSVKNVGGKDYSSAIGRKWVATQAVVPKLTFLFSQEHPGHCSCWSGWDSASLHPILLKWGCCAKQLERLLTGLNAGCSKF